MGVCCVDGCEADDKDDVIYFPVPVAAALRRKWREAIRPSVKLHQDSRICSKHFHTSDYEEVRGKLRLKGRVVPSIFEKKDCSSSTPSPVDTNGALTTDDAQNGGDKQDGRDDDNAAMLVELSVPQFGLLRGEGGEGAGEEGDMDDSAECTIECVPEAILHEESDSNSETELHKEDIEDIIANYHIQQHSKLNNSGSKLNNSDTGGSEKEERGAEDKADSKEKQTNKQKQDTSNKQRLPPETEKEETIENIDNDDDVIEIEIEPQERRPEFIEISVDGGGMDGTRRGAEPETDDCLLLLENVQVDIDPATLMLARQADSDDDAGSNRREDPISLLTSSDEDDVIIQEPHVDTVEVSSETDEDDKPLVTLVKSKVKTKPTKLTRLLWGNLTEYYCFQCNFTTLSKADSERHKLQHSKILLVCEICNFTCASKSMFSRHKKRHKEEKRYKCNQCEYKARHSMSLVYHMKSHDDKSADTIDVDDIHVDDIHVDDITDKYKCSDCRFFTCSRKEITRHAKSCVKGRRVKVKVTHKCDLCSYSTLRRSDLKRHRERKHADVDDECED